MTNNQIFEDKSYEAFNIYPNDFNHDDDKNDKECSKYCCRVKTVRETVCYNPANWRDEEDKKDSCDKKEEPKHDDCEKRCPEKKECKKDDKKEEKKCDDKHEDDKKCDDKHEERKCCCCRPQRRCCNLCCFRNFHC